MRILYLAYPLLPVSDASAGGAEQVLWTLEREMNRLGHETAVAACAGSAVSGRLFATGTAPTANDTYEKRSREHHHAIRNVLQVNEFDIIHDMSGAFFATASNLWTPVLATAHLPRSFYPDINWSDLGRNVSVNCVSSAQAHTFADIPNLVGWVQNGVALERFPFRSDKDDYLLWLGRICEEKAPHLAIEIAKRAGKRLILAGQVYPFQYHQDYFQREIAPGLGNDVQFVDTPNFELKTELLAHAAALLITSQVDETSSLVAMEAAACGTPVIGTNRGALPEVVSSRRTGFVGATVEELASFVVRLREIHPEVCRAHAERYFSAERMAQDYATLYERVVQRAVGEAA